MTRYRARRRPPLARTLIAALLLAAVPLRPARADDASATVRLIQLLIEKGVLTQAQAADLLKQAQEETKPSRKPKPHPPAAAAPAAAEAPPPAPAPPGVASAPTAPPFATPSPAVPPGTVRVTYVPQIVRDQIAAEVRDQVMQQAQKEGWASPQAAAPEWTQRVHFYGDVRLRGERVFEDRGNGPLPDYNSINSGTGFDTSGAGGLPPSLNTLEDRNRLLLRARLGVTADVNDWAKIDMRIATGNDSSPVSTQQTLGNPGDFSKYALWLDTAYLTLQTPAPLEPFRTLKMQVGREPNPFWTSDVMFWEDLNFDGGSVSATTTLSDKVDLFATAGGFYLFDTPFSLSTLNESKFPSHDKYLFAGQVGGVVRPVDKLAVKLAAGLFDFANMQGKLSDPCLIQQTGFGCDSDATRTQFVQFGNTLFPIRNILLTGSSTTTPQYFGLASRFDVLDLHGLVSSDGFAVPVALEGDFTKNLAFNARAIAALGPVNNLSANTSTFHGGDTAYMVKVAVGKTEMAQRWDWNAFIAYKYIESDAVLDALNDPNFHLGGTNAKGYELGASLALAHNLWLAAKWYSANQITGTPYANDLLQVDLNAKF